MRDQQATTGHVQAGRSALLLRLSRPARSVALASILLTSLALAACQTDGSGAASANGGLAFVSIDGPPRGTFDKFVSELNDEARARQVRVAAQDDPGAYRVKGYLSMHVEKGKSSVAYAWDVYGPDKTRLTRITGEEKIASTKGSATGWAACDDAVLARIADRSMSEISATLGVGSAPVAASPTSVATARPASEAPAQEAPAPEAPQNAPEAPATPATEGNPQVAAAEAAPLAYAGAAPAASAGAAPLAYAAN